MLSLQSFLRNGLCWEKLKPKGPEEEIPVSAYRGSSADLKELNVLADKLEDLKLVEQLLAHKVPHRS